MVAYQNVITVFMLVMLFGRIDAGAAKDVPIKSSEDVARQIPGTADQVKLYGDEALKTFSQKVLSVIALNDKSMTFSNTFGAIDQVHGELTERTGIMSLVGATSTDKSAREAAQDMESRLTTWSSENLDLNAPLYHKLVAAFSKTRPKVGSQEDRLAKKILNTMKRSGSALTETEREVLAGIEKEMIKLKEMIEKTVSEDNGSLTFTRDELQGLSEQHLAKLSKEGNLYSVKTRLADQYETVVANAVNPLTRRKTVLARNSRAVSTGDSILRLIKLRSQKAKKLGFRTWADFVIDENMAKKASVALDFIEKFDNRLTEKKDSDIDVLFQLKKRDDPKATVLGLEDFLFYERLLKQEKVRLNPDEVKEYFEENFVIAGLMRIYEQIFELKLEVKPVSGGWVSDLLVVEVSDRRSGKRIGDVYLDLHPRDGKYGHFACFSMTTPMDGSQRNILPSASIVGNWPEKTAMQPSLWTFDQVTTLFHEFGHGLHHIMGKSKYALLASGFFVPGDFVEAPSQSLEYWLKDYNVVKTLSKHYKTGDVMPKDLFDRIVAGEKLNRGYFYKRQMAFAKIDMALHARTEDEIPKDTGVLWQSTNAILDKVIPGVPESKFLASFTHITSGGYSAGYYGYGWADTISADIASEFVGSSKGFMNPELGLKLRKAIYESGNSRDVSHSIRDFLGREWNMEAFFKEIFGPTI